MKLEVQQYKKSIYEIGLPKEQESIIWDFYVTKSIAGSSSQKRSLADYGLKKIPFEQMLKAGGIDSEHKLILLANSITQTLKDNDLDIGNEKKPVAIDVETPRIVCITPYSIADTNKPKAKVGEGESVLTHIRNAFAHGNTYFFDNGNVLLEDKNKNTVTARLILPLQALLDWIKIIDSNNNFYILHDNLDNEK